MVSKFISVADAVSKIKDGMTVMVGGFLSVGGANRLLGAIADSDVKELTIICNDTSFSEKGLGKLFARKKVRKVITSYIGANRHSIEQMNEGDLEVEFCPQGTLAERIRVGGAGLGGVLTPTGVGTLVAEGKQTIIVDGKEFLLEKPLFADIALIGASVCDGIGNLIYKGTAQNFNPLMATAANMVIVEPQRIVETGSFCPEHIKTSAVLIDYILELPE